MERTEQLYKIWEYMAEQNRSRYSTAYDIGISECALRRYLTGKNSNPSTLSKIESFCSAYKPREEA